MKAPFAELKQQRWDDHRFYHHSRINQSLHFISSISFMCAYVVLFFDPAMASLLGWLVGMITRQSGHFFFEPKGYDNVNQATHEHKEEIKVGYNLQRKVILHAVWIFVPVVLYINPTVFGLIKAHQSFDQYAHHVGWAWLFIAVGALIFRGLQLTVLRSPMTAVAWVTKILTDPFVDFVQYRKAPLALLRGELFDPEHGQKHA